MSEANSGATQPLEVISDPPIMEEPTDTISSESERPLSRARVIREQRPWLWLQQLWELMLTQVLSWSFPWLMQMRRHRSQLMQERHQSELMQARLSQMRELYQFQLMQESESQLMQEPYLSQLMQEPRLMQLQDQQQQPGHHGCCLSYYDAYYTITLFLSEILSMVMGANDVTRGFLFLGINGVLIHQLVSVNFVAFEKRNLLNFGEAFNMSLPPMVQISMIFFSFALNLVLLFPVYPAVQCVLILLCILMPLYYFAELAQKAAGIAVNLGSFKMPLIWFSTLGGLAISLICGSLVLLIVFLSWLYARRRGLEFQGIRVNGDGIIGAMNA